MARYFVSRLAPSKATGGNGLYWRATQGFSGWRIPGATLSSLIAAPRTAPNAALTFQVNLNLLARALGDAPPAAPPGMRLVGTETFEYRHRDAPDSAPVRNSVTLQPRVVFATGTSAIRIGLAIPQLLRGFLDNPFGTGSLDLGLPLRDPRATVSECWMRDDEDDDPREFHGGFDFSVRAFDDSPRDLIEVAAVADGEVWMLFEERGFRPGVVLLHEPVSGRRFLSSYRHLRASTIDLAIGDRVVRGQVLGTIRRARRDDRDVSHLHFNVLLRGPGFLQGRVLHPAMWYSIDPFGVYDYHVGRGRSYNYVPTARGGMFEQIRGAERKIHWSHDPPIRSLSGELVAPTAPITELHLRARDAGRTATDLDSIQVRLAGDEEPFEYRAAGGSFAGAIEQAVMNTLRTAFRHRKRVKLMYRFAHPLRRISAVELVE